MIENREKTLAAFKKKKKPQQALLFQENQLSAYYLKTSKL